jgi:SAM-dependent methyltransferase
MEINIETVKSFWDARPCNIEHSKKKVGTKEYFEEVEQKKFFVEPHIKTFSEFEKWNGKRVLEIGCGIGTAAINFAKHGAIYTGLELSSESLSITKQRFAVYNKQGNFFLGNAEQLGSVIPIEKFDLIYSFGVIHHSPNPKKILQEVKQYMDNNTILKVMIYAKNSWKNAMIEVGLDQPEAQSGCPIAFTYSREDIKELFSEFELISVEQDHIFPYQIEPYKNGSYKLQPWFEAMPKEMFRALEKQLGWHMLVTAKLKSTEGDK